MWEAPSQSNNWEIKLFHATNPEGDIDITNENVFSFINKRTGDQCAFLRPVRCAWDHTEYGFFPSPPYPYPIDYHDLRRRDPLIIDLDGNGVQTRGLDSKIVFDHDGNGFKELSGWVATGDGMLLIDGNNNGRPDNGSELFGDFTITPEGGRPASGFQALAYYDANSDGIIDENDPVWSELSVWQYDDTVFELHEPDTDIGGWSNTLDELGIAAIYLDSEASNRVDEAGNTEVRTGSFQWKDGSLGAIAEYNLQRDTGLSVPVETLDVSTDIEELPTLNGHGNVHTLHYAMTLDSSGALRGLVEAFCKAESISQREDLLKDILYKWTGADTVAQDSRGPFLDARKVVLLEQFYGQNIPNPTLIHARFLENIYKEIFEGHYAALMAQTHLKDLYETIECASCTDSGEQAIDTTALKAALDQAIAEDPVKGKELLSEFARTRRGMGFHDDDCFLSLREHFVEQDPSLAWIFDTGGLPVYDQLGQGDGRYYPHMWGTWNSDAVQGHPTAGDGYINGLTGDDGIYGTDRNEKFFQESGDALIVAGGGNDRVYAGEGDDIIDGGASRAYALAA